MKISIITACLNSVETIERCLLSIQGQNYHNTEHIVIDGQSTDGTLNIIDNYSQFIQKMVSEQDEGIYDALNKGLSLATGDIIGFLHSDDFYAHSNVLKEVVENFTSHRIDALYGNLIVLSNCDPIRFFRIYNSSKFSTKMLKFGIMPAHPTLFLRREVYETFGLFKTEFDIASDFELVARIFTGDKIYYKYLDRIMVIMTKGGASSKNYLSNIKINKEIYRSCKINGIKTNYFFIYLKYFLRFIEFLKAKKLQSLMNS